MPPTTIKWREKWMTDTDKNGDKYGEYVRMQNDKYAVCTWCPGSKVNYSVILSV
jgi:hypothetical protein